MPLRVNTGDPPGGPTDTPTGHQLRLLAALDARPRAWAELRRTIGRSAGYATRKACWRRGWTTERILGPHRTAPAVLVVEITPVGRVVLNRHRDGIPTPAERAAFRAARAAVRDPTGPGKIAAAVVAAARYHTERGRRV